MLSPAMTQTSPSFSGNSAAGGAAGCVTARVTSSRRKVSGRRARMGGLLREQGLNGGGVREVSPLPSASGDGIGGGRLRPLEGKGFRSGGPGAEVQVQRASEIRGETVRPVEEI